MATYVIINRNVPGFRHLAPIYTSSCFPNMETQDVRNLKRNLLPKHTPPAKTVFQKGVLSVKNYWEAKLF